MLMSISMLDGGFLISKRDLRHCHSILCHDHDLYILWCRILWLSVVLESLWCSSERCDGCYCCHCWGGFWREDFFLDQLIWWVVNMLKDGVGGIFDASIRLTLLFGTPTSGGRGGFRVDNK